LGTRFTAAVEEAAARALAFPLSGSPFRANTRRVFVQEFPFALVKWARLELKTRLLKMPQE
jgi:hypothetical protein